MFSRIKIVSTICLVVLSSSAYGRGLYLRKNGAVNSPKKAYVKVGSGLALYDKLKKKSKHSTYEKKRGKESYLISLGVGYDFNKNISTEILGRFSPFKYSASEGCAAGASWDSQRMKSYSLFLNVYLKHPLSKQVSFYLTGGPGVSHNRSESLKSFTPSLGNMTPAGKPNVKVPGKNITSFAWNIGAGVGLQMTKKISLNLGYRYLSMGEVGIKPCHGGLAESRKIKAQDITADFIFKL